MKNSRRRSTATSAEQAIQEYMLSGRLHPGDPMPTETELCERLGVSRSSMREAMRTLTALDIVDVRHGTGTFVGDLSLSPLVSGLIFRALLTPAEDYTALRDVVEVRTALDLGLAQTIVQALEGTYNESLHKLVDHMIDLSERDESFTDDDHRFHSQLLAYLPNSLLGQLVEALWEVHMRVLPRLNVPTPADIRQTAVAHGAMLTAAEKGDTVGYREAVIEHYRPLLRVLEQSADTLVAD
jgi:DNA-binding FadR family transcriptional regulator